MNSYKRYELIKRYPFSQKLGTIFHFRNEDSSSAIVYTKNGFKFKMEWTIEYFESRLGTYYKIAD